MTCCPNCGFNLGVSLGLTPRQAEALKFIASFIQERGYSPSYEELREAMGCKSKNTVFRLVDVLQQRGHIAIRRGAARSMTVLPGAAA